MKRVLSFVLAIAMVMSFSTVTAFADTPAIAVSSTWAEKVTGETVSVDVTLSSNPGFIVASLQIGWPKDDLKLISVNDTLTTIPGWNGESIAVGGNSSGSYTLPWQNTLAAADITANGKLCTLEFEILSTATVGEKTITISGSGITNHALESIEDSFTFTSGSITLTQDIASPIVVSDLTAPVKGVTIDTTATLPTGMTAYGVQWYDGETEHSGSFGASKVYRAEIPYTLVTGYTLPENIVVTPPEGATAATIDTKGEHTKIKITYSATAIANPLDGTVTISGTPKFGETLSAVTTGLNYNGETEAQLTYQWKRGADDISGATGSTYNLVEADIGKTITVVVANPNNSGSVTSSETAKVEKADYSATGATAAIATKTDTAVTVTNVIPGQQYVIVKDGATVPETGWQVSGEFTGLTANTNYDLYTRVAATSTTKASSAVETDITTDMSVQIITVPSAQSIKFGGTLNINALCSSNAPSANLNFSHSAPLPLGTGYNTETGEITAGTTAGSFTVYVKSAAVGDYDAAEDKTITVSIVAGDPQTITFTPNTVEKTFGDENFTKTAQNNRTDGGTITYVSDNTDVATVDSATGEVTIVGQGTATITATAAAVDGKYVSGSGNYTLTVNKKTITDAMVAAVSGSLTYTGSAQTPEPAVTGLTKGTDFDYSYENNTVAGTAAVTVTGKGNYQGTVTKNFTISKKPVTAIASTTPVTKVYDGDNTVDTAITFTFTGVGSDGTITVTTSGNTYNDKNAGTGKAITIGTKSADGLGNYDVTYPAVTGEITAKPVDVTIDGDGGPVVFGTSFSHTASATLLTGDTATYTVLYDGNAAKPTNAGTYPLSVAISNTNYSVNPYTASFIISKADITALSDKTTSVRDTDKTSKTYALSGFGTPPCAGVWTRDSYSATLFSVNPAINENGTNLTFTVSSIAEAGYSGTVMLKFTPTEPANYNEKTVTLTVNVIDKEPATVTVSMDNWKYGETAKEPTKNVAFADSQAKDNPVWTITYSGTLSDGSSTAYAESATKPTVPGSYTVKAAYEDDNHKGVNTANFTIEKSDALTITGLKALDKNYNNTTKAEAEGTPAVSGKIGTDDVTIGTIKVETTAFADAEIGNNKNVAVTLSGAIGGADAWKYEAVPTTITLKANITVPATPVPLGDDNLDLAWQDIEAKYAGYNVEIKSAYADAKAIKDVLLEKAKDVISTITDNIAYFDLEVVRMPSGNPTHGGATIFMPYPSGSSINSTFVVEHMKHDGTIESPAVTKAKYGIIFTVSETSPFAVAWRTSVSNGGGSYSASFWDTVESNIKNAKDGATIKVDAGNNDQLPWEVMQALRKNPEVSLVIEWKGGKKIVIPAGKALADESGRVYYPLSYLAEKYKEYSEEEINPNTGADIMFIQAQETDSAFTPTPSYEGMETGFAVTGYAAAFAVILTAAGVLYLLRKKNG